MIRPATSKDFNFIYNLYMHPHVNPFLLYELIGEEAFRPIFDDLLHEKIKYIYTNDDQPIGMFKLIPHQHRSQHIVYLGGLALLPEFSGKGQGSKMIQEIIAFAHKKGFLRIELSVAITNEKAIRLYEKSGFQQEGILRKYTHLVSKNEFIDEILMSLIF
jgi:RimJ/RimL family protein N-acetyltransferase